MKFEEFELERNQSLFEHEVDYNLSESGLHPLPLKSILTEDEQQELLETELIYGYTTGTPMLREKIADLYTGADFDNVLATSGSAEANFVAVMTLLEPGDELIYMVPNYLQIRGIARSFGITVKELPLREELGWQWDMKELESMISSKTKMIGVCHPNNPTGSIVSKENMGKIIDIASGNDCWILSDEVYRGAELNGIESPSFYGNYEKTIVNAGLSKAYRLPGLRIGWTVGPKDYIKKAWAFHDYTSISIAYHSDWVASRILDTKRRKQILDGTKQHLNQNMNTLVEWIDTCDGKLSLSPPQAGAIAFVRIKMDIPSQDLTYHIRDNFSVLLTAGKWFGLEGFLRFGYGPPNEYLLEALDRIGQSLEAV
jgi:aspartate/methionine/tyrosine aminotransferase|tara:strand:+ start:656 stop:1765 length:1110 start_codon:yes stop_codon:yes gene_type:complete